jgi:hypothetical protein
MKYRLLKFIGPNKPQLQDYLIEQEAKDEGERWLQTQQQLNMNFKFYYKIQKITNLSDFKVK